MSNTIRRQLRDRISAGRRQGAREYQEDNYLVVDLREFGVDDDDSALLLLADGMGGHAGGAIASELVVKKFGASFLEHPKSDPLPERLSGALQAANGAVADAVQADPSLKGMGCTLIAAVVHADKLIWLSIGDSPLWLFRNGALVRLNEDHSMKPFLDSLVEKGELTAEEAEQDPSRNALRSAIDGNPPELVDLRSTGYRLQGGDLLLMASDGLESLAERDIIANLEASAHLDVESRLNNLLDAVIKLNVSYQDNTTAILLEPVLSEATRRAADDRTMLLDRTLERPPIASSDEQRGQPGAAAVQKNTRRGGTRSSPWVTVFIVAIALLVATVSGALALQHFHNSAFEDLSGEGTPDLSDEAVPPGTPGSGSFESELNNGDANLSGAGPLSDDHSDNAGTSEDTSAPSETNPGGVPEERSED